MLSALQAEAPRGYIARSKGVERNTPPRIVEAVRVAFGGRIDLDPCSNAQSQVFAKAVFALPNNGLELHWGVGTAVYCNPPFGRYGGTTIAAWVDKCSRHARHNGGEVIALIPAAVDTKHWQDIVFPTAQAVCFIRGRVRFLDGTTGEPMPGPAPMPVALIYWGGNEITFRHATERLGHVIDLNRVRD